MEALSRLTAKCTQDGLLEPFHVSNGEVKVGMLQFADDKIFFTKVTFQALSAIKVILFIFERVSSLKVNLAKSSLAEVGLIPNLLEMADFLGCVVGELPFKDLGLSLGASYKSVEVWNPVIENVQKCLSGWKRKILSKEERLVLTKSTLASIRIYHLSLLTILSSVANKLDKIVRDFFWGSYEEKRKIHLVAWDKVCTQREEGGLGIRNIKEMNQALLSKWIWRYGKEQQALRKKVIDAKYGHCHNGGTGEGHDKSHKAMGVANVLKDAGL